ncbi:hypothetical protein JKF63_02663 [Porcisia hertigi]|uniref:Uncharacterized protein n=1 Tax=Porcisia hertigi TaxID=2761500 RepID=A0A836IFC8_9TRYP|nr:hypothetical protein JKF63_02663 [Porcisia hertigi]
MKLLTAVAFIICAVVVMVNHIPDDDVIEPLHDLLLSYKEEALKSRYGDSRSFNHSETRRIYNLLLTEAQKSIMNSQESGDRKAYTCSKMRSQVRRYARSLDGTYSGPLTEIVLQLRDSFVHGIKHLPLALRKDVSESLALQRPFFFHTAIVVRQSFYCLAPTLSGGECPSYTFLRVIRGKGDTEILESCTRSNKGFNNV